MTVSQSGSRTRILQTSLQEERRDLLLALPAFDFGLVVVVVAVVVVAAAGVVVASAVSAASPVAPVFSALVSAAGGVVAAAVAAFLPLPVEPSMGLERARSYRIAPTIPAANSTMQIIGM